MAGNIVSQPPLTTAISDGHGMLSKAWSIWFRDLYRRTAFKGGNAIDENTTAIDGAIESLADVIIVVENHEIRISSNTGNIEINASAITANADNITLNADAIIVNADNLTDHEALETAHGSNGNIVGFNDLATESLNGLVKRMATLADATTSIVSVVTADAAVAPALYDQAHSQSLVDLSNANKAAINLLVTDLNSSITVLNNLIARSKTSGQMTT